MAGNSARRRVSVTSRVLDLLGAFDDEHRSLTLTGLAGRAGLPPATAHRLVAELVPVQDRAGEVVAALGIVVPRLGRDRARLVSALQVAARGIGRSLPA